ncbi:SPOR domain-containing protein [Zhouia sp. PK063]|uniref:SPOR domain-containing protein n=1 Tax=Zhouia sp. PK063 TaxID=3373602 RepID=UPI0037BDD215
MRLLQDYKHFILAILAVFFIAFAQAQSAKINISQDVTIQKLVEAKKTVNKSDAEKRYRIQIYNGNVEEAKTTLEEFKTLHPDIVADLRFIPQTYRVWVGKFRNRLEADKYLVEVKKNYPAAFILIP